MTLNEFEAYALTKESLDWDKAYGAQCVDLIRFYIDKVLHLVQPLPGKDAADWWFKFNDDQFLKENFIKVPNEKDTVPYSGDIAVWNRHPKNNNCGHIGIVLDADLFDMGILEQNFTPQKVGVRKDKYQNCLGFLRVKA